MIHGVRFRFAAVVLAAAGCLSRSAAAEDAPAPTTAKEWVEVLSKGRERIPKCVVTWKMVREIPGNPAMAAAMAKDRDKAIAEAANEREREMQIRSKESLVASVANAQTIPMTITLEYHNPGRFFISQLWEYPDQSLLYEYSAHDDGTIYAARSCPGEARPRRNVRMTRATVLEELSRGFPEFVWSPAVRLARELKLGDAKGAAAIVLEGTSEGGTALRIEVDPATRQFLKCQRGNVGASAGLAILRDEIAVARIRMDSGYPLPDEVVWTSYRDRNQVHMRETWTLTEFKARPEPSAWHDTKFQFKPGDIVTDETGPERRTFLIDPSGARK